MARNRKRAARGSKAPRMNVVARLHPPQIRANIEMAHRYRFTSSAGTAKTITDVLLLTAAGVLAVGATQGYSLYQAVRVKRVSIWSPPSAQGAAVSCSIYWLPGATTGTGGRGTEVSDTSLSVAEPAYVSSVPPRDSPASFWQNGSGTNLFVLVAPSGSAIDVELQLTLADGVIAVAPASATLVAASTGSVYYCGLDSATKASAIYLPVSLTSL